MKMHVAAIPLAVGTALAGAGAPAAAALAPAAPAGLRPLVLDPAAIRTGRSPTCVANVYLQSSASKGFLAPERAYQGSTTNLVRAHATTRASNQRMELCSYPEPGPAADSWRIVLRSTSAGRYVRTEPKAAGKFAGQLRAVGAKRDDAASVLYLYHLRDNLIGLRAKPNGKFVTVETAYTKGAKNMLRASKSARGRGEVFWLWI